MDEITTSAQRYIVDFGRDAALRVEADRSRAIERTDWDEFTRLGLAMLRVQDLLSKARAKSRLAQLIELVADTSRAGSQTVA